MVSKTNNLTLDFFEIPQETALMPGSLNISNAVRHLMYQEIKNSPLSRSAIAAQMGDLLGVEISKLNVF